MSEENPCLGPSTTIGRILDETESTASTEILPGATSRPSKTGHLELLTESRLKSRRRCPREHQLRYELGYESTADREALRFGTLMHKALEAWWRWNGPAEERLDVALAAIEVCATPETDPFELVRANELMRGYHWRWKGEDYETVGVEEEFRTPLINPETGAASRTWMRAGKLDVRAWSPDRRKVFVEHKTAGRDIGPGSVYWAKLRMDGQVSGYFRGCDSLDWEAEACVYDVIGKVKLKPLSATPVEARQYTKEKSTKCSLCRVGIPGCLVCGGAGKVVTEPSRLYSAQRDTDETVDEYRARVRDAIAEKPEAYYQRGEVVRLESEMREHDMDTWQTAGAMRDERRLGLAPRNTDACERYESLCSFFQVCSGDALISDERLYRKLPSVHAELTEGGDHATQGR